MKANELRIGNWVENTRWNKKEDEQGFIMQIESIDEIGINVSWDYYGLDYYASLLKIKPIPLTEEWLVKFGMNHLSDDKAGWYCETNDMKMFIFVEEKDFYSSMFYVHKWNDVFYFAISTIDDGRESFEHLAKIQHVHQLQNLYFALTNEELCIN